MSLADQWQHMLDAGIVRNRAELARRAGVSAMWVTHVLALLKLHPEIEAWVRALPPGTPERYVTERRLREMAKLPRAQQLKAARRTWPRGVGSPASAVAVFEVRFEGYRWDAG